MPEMYEGERAGDESPPRPLIELRDTGMLWLINRVVFHPRGLALALARNKETNEIVGWRMEGDGSQCWSFTEADDESFAQAQAFLKACTTPDAEGRQKAAGDAA